MAAVTSCENVLYKAARNLVIKMLRSAEAQYWKNKFAESQDSRSFWKTVNEVTGKSKSKRIGLLRDANNNEVSNDSEKADLINSYFINIGKELTENSQQPMKSVSSCIELPLLYRSWRLTSISSRVILRVLNLTKLLVLMVFRLVV